MIPANVNHPESEPMAFGRNFLISLGLVTGLASLALGGLILTGYSDVVPPLVSE